MIDINKKYQTRDRREVRIYCTDAGGDYPVHGAVKVDGAWEPDSWEVDGKNVYGVDSSYDLMEVPETIEIDGWINVYDYGLGDVFKSKDSANLNSLMGRIACIRIQRTVTKGEGLNE